MDTNFIVQVVSCALTTLCSMGAIGAAVWTVWESRRPQPIVFLEHGRDKACVLIAVQNFGSGVARELEIVGFDYEVMVGERYRETVAGSFVGTGIPLLVPGARRDTLILAGPADLHGHEAARCDVTLKYKEKGILGRDREVKEGFVLDIGSFAGSVYSASEIHEIAKASKKTSESLTKITDLLARMNSGKSL